MIDQELMLQRLQERLREILDRENMEDVPVEVWEKENPYISGIHFSIPISVKEVEKEDV